MALFAVVAQDDGQLETNIRREFPADNILKLRGQGQWLIDTSGTAQSVGEKLGLATDKTLPMALVLPFTSYWGLYTSDVWDWIKQHIEGQR